MKKSIRAYNRLIRLPAAPTAARRVEKRGSELTNSAMLLNRKTIV